MTAPRTQTTRARGLFITNETAPLLGAVVEGADEDPVDEGPEDPEVDLGPLLPPPLRVVVPLEDP